ncbi:MAG TPA: hypothetical protein VGK00_07750 [Anaerolineales bacterium]|jgi:hypothetical protein
MNALDLSLLSIYRINGQEWPLLPGLWAQNPAKKPARGREQDRLLVYLTLAGNSSFSNNDYAGMVSQIAETFYNTPGSLTFALKSAAGWLNTHLVDLNMKSTGKGLFTIGALVLGNLRGNSMYIVQAGPTHVYHLAAGDSRHLYDPLLAGKGLGLSQVAHMYFAQVTLAPGDRLLACAALPPNWEKSITEARGSTSMEITRRRLLAITDTNVSALLLKASDGSGVTNILKAVEPVAAEAAIPPVSPAPVPALAASPAVVQEKTPSMLPAEPENSATLEEVIKPDAPVAAVEAPAPSPMPVEQVQPDPQVVSPVIRKARPLIDPAQRQKFIEGLRSTALYLANSIHDIREWAQKFKTWASKAIPRLLPENESDQSLPTISKTWGIFFSIAIPVLLLVAARIVYYQFGFEAQYKIYYNHAQESAQQALAESSPSALRVEWQTTLDWLDRADQYQQVPSPESQSLRQSAQAALDSLDKVIRFNFVPAFGTQPGLGTQVVRMAASDTDIYLLDATRGTVIRGVFNGKNFDVDNTFECGPGNYSGIRVDKLIDIVTLPHTRTDDPTLMGIDGSGNLIYCIPGEAPRAGFLQMPDTGWKGITSISYDEFNLYVLDAPARAVWVYFGSEKHEFAEKPYFFFEEQVPVMLEQAISMAMNGDDLYLLHKDGHMTTCTFSHIASSPTRCNDPALYVDTRPGYEGGMNLSDGIFSQIAFTSAPDPSVALLEPFTQSIFRFSPRALELQNQVRAGTNKDSPLPRGMPVTAMAFSPNKNVFMYVNGQLFFSKNSP